jgi:hypothetical protein
VILPTEPCKLGKLLPTSLSDTSVPICVVFIGSQPPTQEWLREKAKPLLVRPKVIRDALIWLQNNNELYKDIEINEELLMSLPENSILPVEICIQDPSIAIDSQGSRYDEAVLPVENDSNTGEPKDLLSSIIVSDVDGAEISPLQMKSIAMRHLMSGKGFIQLPHGPELSNEYTDENLFPLLYPSLFPYGKGGFGLSSRKGVIENL